MCEQLEDRMLLSGSLPSVAALLGSKGTFLADQVALPVSSASSSSTKVARAVSGKAKPLLIRPNFIGFSNPGTGAFTPGQISTGYAFSGITFGSTAGTGAGQTIAIVDAFDNPDLIPSTSGSYSSSDLHIFDSKFGIADTGFSFTKINQTGGSTLPGSAPLNSWGGEEDLDVEWAHALAPGANIVLVEANSASISDLTTAVQTAEGLAGVSVVSMSWSSPDTNSSDPLEPFFDSIFHAPSGHAGVTFVTGAGDNGSPGDLATAPSVSADVLSVGGTQLTLNGSNQWSSEVTWNDGIDPTTGLLDATGGGPALAEPQPTYQPPVAGFSTTRLTPDVAFDASAAHSPVWIYDAYDDVGQPGNWTEIGGTSLGAPAWSALIAISNQGRVINGLSVLDGTGQTLPLIYQAPTSDFHDIISGNNFDTSQPGYSAGPLFDEVTGRGSPIANQLIPYLASTNVPYVLNPGFELGNINGWVPQFTGAETAVSGAGHTGNYALQLNAQTSNAGVTQTIAGLQANTTYILTGYAKVTSGNAQMAVFSYGGPELIANFSSSTYQPNSLVFTTGAGVTQVIIQAWRGQQSTGVADFDDFSLEQLTPAANLGFESGSFGSWQAQYAGTESIATGNAHSGTYALQLNAASGNAGAIETVTGLTPNTTYVLSAYGKVTSGTDLLAVLAYGGPEITAPITSASYSQQFITFTTGSNETSAVIQGWRGGTQSGTGYFDDFSITQLIPSANLGFENGMLTPWTINPGNSSTVQAVESNSDGGVGNVWSLQLNGTTSSAGATETISNLQPNTTYILSAFGKVASGGQSQLSVFGYGGNPLTSFISSTSYTQHFVVFSTGPTDTSAGITGFVPSGQPGLAYFDDFNVQQLTSVDNMGFETGDLTNWTPQFSGSAETVVNNNTWDGKYALQLNASSSSAGVLQTINNLQPNTTYTLSAFGMVTAGNDQLAVLGYAGAGSETSVSYTSTSYTQQSITFTTGAAITSVTIQGWRGGTQSGLGYFDDFNLVQDQVTNPGFETGDLTGWSSQFSGTETVVNNNAFDGTYALQMNAQSGNAGVLQTINYLHPNTTYTLSAWGKVTAGNEQLAVLGYAGAGSELTASYTSSGYTQQSIQFTTGSGITSITIQGWRGGTQTGLGYFDDFSLVAS